MSILIQATEIRNSQGQSTSISKLYGVPYINLARQKGSNTIIIFDGKNKKEERIVSESYSTISGLLSSGYADTVLPLTVKSVIGTNVDSYPYSLSIRSSQIVEVYADPKNTNDSIVRVRDEDKAEDIFYTVDEDLTTILTSSSQVSLGLKEYRATITQSGTSAPVLTVISNTLGVTLTPSRDGAGLYKLTSPSAIFLAGKTYANISDFQLNGSVAEISRISDTEMAVYAGLASTLAPGDGRLIGNSIIIKVAP